MQQELGPNFCEELRSITYLKKLPKQVKTSGTTVAKVNTCC